MGLSDSDRLKWYLTFVFGPAYKVLVGTVLCWGWGLTQTGSFIYCYLCTPGLLYARLPFMNLLVQSFGFVMTFLLLSWGDGLQGNPLLASCAIWD